MSSKSLRAASPNPKAERIKEAEENDHRQKEAVAKLKRKYEDEEKKKEAEKRRKEELEQILKDLDDGH